MSEQKVESLAERKGDKQTPPYVWNGSLEAEDYGAWARSVLGKEGRVVEFAPAPAKKK